MDCDLNGCAMRLGFIELAWLSAVGVFLFAHPEHGASLSALAFWSMRFAPWLAMGIAVCCAVALALALRKASDLKTRFKAK